LTLTRLHDFNRVPAHWTQLVLSGQYPVLVFDADSHTHRDPDGRLFEAGEASIVLCESLDEALLFSNGVVGRHPELCCEIYDHEGKSNPPLRALYHPSVRGRYAGKGYAKRETLQGAAALTAGIVFIAIDASRDLAWFWGYILGIKLTIVGVAFLVRGLTGRYEHRAESNPIR